MSEALKSCSNPDQNPLRHCIRHYACHIIIRNTHPFLTFYHHLRPFSSIVGGRLRVQFPSGAQKEFFDQETREHAHFKQGFVYQAVYALMLDYYKRKL